jgi:hypothetical protein
MASSAYPLDPAATSAPPARRLVARTVPATSVDSRTRAQMYALFASAYEGTARSAFERDLAEKQRVILLHDALTGRLGGFSTVLLQPVITSGGAGTVVFSGDTVIDPRYWGQKQLQSAFARLLFSLKLQAPTRPLYWFLISKGYRTYLLLANAFPRAVPRHDRPEAPALRALLDELAATRFGQRYDHHAGIVRNTGAHERVRDGLAPVTEALLANPHVRYFIARNPAHADGDELACLADVRLRDLVRTSARIARARMRRALGASTVRSAQ